MRRTTKAFWCGWGGAERFSLGVYAYVLMGNHYHLLVRTRQAHLSAAIQWLGVSYSAWHNARHQRSGHLFQGRFKSFMISEDAYLYRLLLYIHRNPLRTDSSGEWQTTPGAATGPWRTVVAARRGSTGVSYTTSVT